MMSGWPSELIAVLLLNLPLLGTYFPTKFHQYFKPRGEVTLWFVPSDVNHSSFPEGTGLLVSGSASFIDRVLSGISPSHWLIASVLFWLHGSTMHSLYKDQVVAKEVLNCHNLRVVSFVDANIGGAMDACHMFGFGGDLALDVLPCLLMGLPRTLRHFLDRGTTGFFPGMAWVA
jgi:hypothetical protein